MNDLAAWWDKATDHQIVQHDPQFEYENQSRMIPVTISADGLTVDSANATSGGVNLLPFADQFFADAFDLIAANALSGFEPFSVAQVMFLRLQIIEQSIH